MHIKTCIKTLFSFLINGVANLIKVQLLVAALSLALSAIYTTRFRSGSTCLKHAWWISAHVCGSFAQRENLPASIDHQRPNDALCHPSLCRWVAVYMGKRSGTTGWRNVSVQLIRLARSLTWPYSISCRSGADSFQNYDYRTIEEHRCHLYFAADKLVAQQLFSSHVASSPAAAVTLDDCRLLDDWSPVI